MDVREKLVGLLREVQYLGGLEEKIADHLIANDVVPVVRCKDCKHFVSPQGVPCCDEFMGLGFPNDDGSDFCSYGERREGE